MRTYLIVFCAIAAGAAIARAEPQQPTIDQLVQSLGSNDFAERLRALDALAARRTASAEHLPALRERLRDNDPAARQQAAMALAALGVDEQPVIDELLAGMGRRSGATYLSQPEPARASMAALVKLAELAVPSLIAAVEDKEYASRDLALEALGQIGPAAKDALPVIERRIATDDVATLCQVVEVKWRIDDDAAFAIERLMPLLDRPPGRQFHAVAHALVHMGADAKEAMPTLIGALKRTKDHNLLWAVGELAPHDPDVALPALRGALTQPRLADDAAIALQSLGEPADQLVPKQLARLRECKPNDGNEPIRIVYTIVIHGPAAKDYAPELIALLQHDNPEVRRAAAWGIPRMFADDNLVIAALQNALLDPETAEEAAKGLKMLREARQ